MKPTISNLKPYGNFNTSNSADNGKALMPINKDKAEKRGIIDTL